MTPDIRSYTPEELQEYLAEVGEPRFRAGQVFEWLHKKHVSSFDEMTNLSKGLRQKLSENTNLTTLAPLECRVSNEDDTRKYLFALSDGNIIESVRMKYHYGNSVCISSQAGCRMGCRFCASTIDGLSRNLTASEMLEQIYAIERDLGEPVGHVVIMGSGEPLDNYDNLVRFLQLIAHPNGKNLSHRNITVSTCGIVPKIYELADMHLQITLALSLHGATQEKRAALMPVANRYHINEVLEACRYYFDTTGRRMTYEYSLVAGVNDTDDDAAQLIKLLAGMQAHVNLIPVNPIEERDFVQPSAKAAMAFKNKLEKNGLHVTIRREMGRDINGACGQLRRSFIKENG